MTTLIPIQIDENNFSEYGELIDLSTNGTGTNVKKSSGSGYTDSYSIKPLIDRPGSLGMTYTQSLPYSIESIERHMHTEEAMFCISEPIAFLVANSSFGEPEVEHMKAFYLTPGQVVVLKPGVWHSPALGMNKPTNYYWMAEAYDDEPSVWADIKNGPIKIALASSED